MESDDGALDENRPFLTLPEKQIKNRNDFEKYLIQRGADGEIGSFLQMITTVSTFGEPSELVNELENHGFVEKASFGNLRLFETETVDKESSDVKVIPYLMFYDEDLDMQYFLTRARKTDEMPKTILSFINETKDISNLWIAPSIMREIKDALEKKFADNFQLSYFTAIRNANTARIKAEKRPQVYRTIQYNGLDGKLALAEMEYAYGVQPKIMEVRVGPGCRFRIDDNGILTIRDGQIRPVFDTLDIMTSRIMNISKAVLSSRCERKNVSGIERWVQHPWLINMPNGVRADLENNFAKEMSTDDWGFIPVMPYIEEDTPYLSGRIMDSRKSSSFDIEVTKHTTRVYPIERMDIGSALRFYQFVSQNQDFDAGVGILD